MFAGCARAYNGEMNVWRIMRRGVAWGLVLLAVAVVLLPQGEGEAEARTVVRVWNVDTFEGGKGSRTSFLKSVARTMQGEAYYLVTSYTLEGARAAFEEGEAPDVLSFGVGLSEFTEKLLPLSGEMAEGAVSGGEMGGDVLAVPWCMGGYYLFVLSDFAGEGRTAVSVGGENLSCVAAGLEGIRGEEAESLAAYTGFLSGKYRYLLGTQRDICRFSARGVQVEMRPLLKYNDLFQYVGILSAEKREEAEAFAYALLSPETQGRLSEIGMFPPEKKAEYTVSVFSSEAALGEIARSARAGEDIGKFLKSI